MIAIKLIDLRKASMSIPGLFQAIVEAGKFSGDHVELEREAFDKVNQKFFNGVRLGSLTHKAINPIATVLDFALGTNLAGCGDCASREIRLNTLTTTFP